MKITRNGGHWHNHKEDLEEKKTKQKFKKKHFEIIKKIIYMKNYG